MKQLLSPQKLAELVSNVTDTMVGIKFLPAEANEVPPQIGWRTAVLPIDGIKPLVVGLSSDDKGCAVLSSAMFSCGANEVDNSMMNDSLCELVNMTAGLVRSAMALDQALGLPQMLGVSADVEQLESKGARGIRLKADGIGMVLWIHEGKLLDLKTAIKA